MTNVYLVFENNSFGTYILIRVFANEDAAQDYAKALQSATRANWEYVVETWAVTE